MNIGDFNDLGFQSAKARRAMQTTHHGLKQNVSFFFKHEHKICCFKYWYISLLNIFTCNVQLKLFLILVAVFNPCIVQVYSIELECVKHYIDTKYMYMYLPCAT